MTRRLLVLLFLLLALPALAQEELRGGKKGTTAPMPITGTAIDANHNAVDVTVLSGGVAQSGVWNITNITGTVSLPTGASTSALQDGIIRSGAGDTTQANVITGRLSVDGSGVTQPVSGTVTVGVFPDNEPFNVAQVAGVATVTAAGGVQKVGIVGSANGAFDAANNAAAPANVVVQGFETATQTVTQPTAATTGNVRRAVARTDGVLYVVPGGPVQWQCNLGAVAATLTQCQAAPGAGLRLYITDIVAVSTTTTSGLFTLRFGTGANCGTGTGNLFFASAAATIPNLPNAAASGFKGGKTEYVTPIAVTAINAVCVLGVATNTTNIQISGYTAP